MFLLFEGFDTISGLELMLQCSPKNKRLFPKQFDIVRTDLRDNCRGTEWMAPVGFGSVQKLGFYGSSLGWYIVPKLEGSERASPGLCSRTSKLLN